MLNATPTDVVEGNPVNVSISGLQPGQEVILHASRLWSLYPIGEELYRGQAAYRADGAGKVDLGSSKPLPGSSYERVDPAGLFWSMAPERRLLANGPRQGPPLVPQAELRPGQVRLEAEIAGRIVARADVWLRGAAPDVAVREIREPGVVGLFARGPGSGRQPAIIVLGGSEGGLDTARWAAPLLASHGYAVLGLAYFQGGEPALTGLRPNLEHIPLETLEAARRWLARQNGVDASRVAVIGVSKGAELALVAGATFPWVGVVGAFAPSHVVWEGIPTDDQPDRSAGSSWTYRGRPLPYVRWSKAAERRGDQARTATGSSRLTEVHLESLAEYASDVEAAAIPIERSRAAVFIAGGTDDAMWPSAYAAERLRERLARRDPGSATQIEVHPTGHLLLGSGWGPTTQFQRTKGRLQGGNPGLDAEAQQAIWPKFLLFLRRHLKERSPVRPEESSREGGGEPEFAPAFLQRDDD
jgi:dienelactone hydrolase